MQEFLTIAAISQATGIPKEVLRKWEERYGFPAPERDSCGHRTYGEDQAARLKLIKRLIDSGMRPAQVVPLEKATLQSLLQVQTDKTYASNGDTRLVVELMSLLRSRDNAALTEKLKHAVRQLGLEKFVLEVMCALNVEVGDAWERGEIGIRDEHVYSEVIQNLIREEISFVTKRDGQPRILVTTPAGELHTLGILMVDALASLHGACCISLGAQTPLEEIPHAISDYRADIVCFCFSAAFPKRRILPFLKALRSTVPKQIEIWIGGAGTVGLDRSPRGINVMTSLQDIIEAVGKYRLVYSLRLAQERPTILQATGSGAGEKGASL